MLKPFRKKAAKRPVVEMPKGFKVVPSPKNKALRRLIETDDFTAAVVADRSIASPLASSPTIMNQVPAVWGEFSLQLTSGSLGIIVAMPPQNQPARSW